MIKQREQENLRRIEEQKKPEPEPFKMRRFQSVESKLGQQMGAESHRMPTVNEQPVKLNKAQQMKIRMAKERGEPM